MAKKNKEFFMDPWSARGIDEEDYERLIIEFGIERIGEIERQIKRYLHRSAVHWQTAGHRAAAGVRGDHRVSVEPHRGDCVSLHGASPEGSSVAHRMVDPYTLKFAHSEARYALRWFVRS